MEKEGSYRLPQKWRRKEGGFGSAIEAAAHTLRVPVGYFLAGFDVESLSQSCFGPAISAGTIQLQNELTSTADRLTLQTFLDELPTSEADLLNRPLHNYLNEYAFAAIFRLEQAFDSLEMLLVNEPPLIFWDADDIEAWVRNMALDRNDADVFKREFTAYQSRFKALAQQGKKHYKIVLNRNSFRVWLKRKRKKAAIEQIEAMLRFNAIDTFGLALLKSQNSLEEAEVISKHAQIPKSYSDTLAVQIVQTPPNEGPTEYSVTPLPQSVSMVRRQRERIDRAWEEAVDQMLNETQKVTPGVRDYRLATGYVLQELKREIEDKA